MNAAALFLDLLTLRDKLKLQAHLFELDLKDHWLVIENKVNELETHLMQRAQQLGVAEQHYFVGSDEQIKVLLNEIRKLDKQVND